MKKIVFVLIMAIFVAVIGLVGMKGVKYPQYFVKVPATRVYFDFDAVEKEQYRYTQDQDGTNKRIRLDSDLYVGTGQRLLLSVSLDPKETTTDKVLVKDSSSWVCPDPDHSSEEECQAGGCTQGHYTYEIITELGINFIIFNEMGVYTITITSSYDTTVQDVLRVTVRPVLTA